MEHVIFKQELKNGYLVTTLTIDGHVEWTRQTRADIAYGPDRLRHIHELMEVHQIEMDEHRVFG